MFYLFLASRCGPCKFIAPIYENMAKENPEVEFLKCDVDEADQVAAANGISAMPTFQFFKDGVKVAEIRGADKNSLEKKIKELK